MCKEPSCRRRFSVQSNLKRHAKVHQLGASGLGGAAMQGVGAARGHMHPPPSRYGYHPYQRHPGNHGGAVRKHENWDPEEDELDEDELDDEDEEE